VDSIDKNTTTVGKVSEITFGYDAMQHRISKFVEHYSSTDYEKSYYIYDAQGNVMAIYSENKVSSVTTTKLDELPIYGSDRLGLVRRNLELSDQDECPYCPVPQTIAPGQLRIVEVLYDSPLSNPTEDHEGEFIILRNATGITIPLASISVTYPGGVYTFGASDELPPYEFAIVANWTGSPGSFAAQYGLTGYNSNPAVNWFFHNTMTLPDAGGTVGLLDFTDGVPTLLDAVNFGGSGITASNAYCATACSTAQTVQLDHFLTSPSGAFDAGEWSAATITGMGTIGIGSFVLDHSHARGLGTREYELKDHLGNVRVVVSDKKMSDIVSGLPEDFRAEVLTMRDHYAFGMDLPGAVFTGSSGYRYGFNGMERDDEVKGSGMSYDFGARVYDPRVGRWWSCDPKEKKYPSISGYVFVANTPIMAIDPNGEEIYLVYGKRKYRYDGKNLIPQNGRFGKMSESEMKWLSETRTNLNLIKNDDIYAKSIIEFLTTSEKKVRIEASNRNYTMNSSGELEELYDAVARIEYDPSKKEITDQTFPNGSSFEGDWNTRDPRVGLADELYSAYSIVTETEDRNEVEAIEYVNGVQRERPATIPMEEINAVNFSNRIRLKTGDPLRRGYGGLKIPERLLESEYELKKDKTTSDDGKGAK
jgi:RHS repeat-associated protein